MGPLLKLNIVSPNRRSNISESNNAGKQGTERYKSTQSARDSFAGVLKESALGVWQRKLDLHVGLKHERIWREMCHYLNVTLHVPVLMSHIFRVLSYDPLTTFSSSTCKNIIDHISDLAITQG